METKNYVIPDHVAFCEGSLREHIQWADWSNSRKWRARYQGAALYACTFRISPERFKVIAAEELAKKDIVLSEDRQRWLTKISYGYGERKLTAQEAAKAPSEIPPLTLSPMPAVTGEIPKPLARFAASVGKSPK